MADEPIDSPVAEGPDESEYSSPTVWEGPVADELNRLADASPDAPMSRKAEVAPEPPLPPPPPPAAEAPETVTPVAAQVVEMPAAAQDAAPAADASPEFVSREQYEALLALMNNQQISQGQAGFPGATPTASSIPQAPNGAPQPSSVPTAPQQPPAPVINQPFVTAENLEQVFQTPEGINALLNTVALYAKQEAMRETDSIARIAAKDEAEMQGYTQAFFQANPDLAPYNGPVLAAIANQFQAQYPTYSKRQLFIELGPYARQALRIAKSQATAQAAQQPPARPRFAPAPSAVPTGTNPRQDQQTAWDQLNRMHAMTSIGD